MTQLETPIKFSYRDYQNLPESETKRYELLGGELVMVPAPSWFHQSIAGTLFQLLAQFVRGKALGEVRFAPLDVVLSEEDVVQPDILFVSNERRRIIHEDGIHGAPDLHIEILSPTTAGRDRTLKRTLYARHGVREYWLVDPETKTIEVLRLGPQGYQLAGHYERGQTLRSPLLAGLIIPLDEVF